MKMHCGCFAGVSLIYVRQFDDFRIKNPPAISASCYAKLARWISYLRSNFNQLKRSALCRLILILHITQEAFYQNNRRTNQSAK